MPAQRNSSKLPSCVMASNTIATKPAAGPATLICEVLNQPIIIPPIIPEIMPESGGAPDASAMPKQSGKATRKTTNPEAKFCLNSKDLRFSWCKVWGMASSHKMKLRVITQLVILRLLFAKNFAIYQILAKFLEISFFLFKILQIHQLKFAKLG